MSSEKDKTEKANWKIPKAGDTMSTPTGDVEIVSVTEYSWSARRGYGNIPFWEGGNWRIFKVKN